MKYNSYLDIYKEEIIVLQLWKDIFLKTNSNDFFDYLNFLKNEKINFVLLDEKWSQIFKSDWNNYFLDKNKNNISDSIKNILLLEKNCKILDNKWEKIEFLSKDKLHKILKQEHKNIVIANNSKLYKKLNEIYKLLENWVNKITLTNSWWLKEELEWFGSWTMFVNLEKAKFKKLNNDKLFKQIYEYQFKNWNWKERTNNELIKISNRYEVYELDWTILWWYALNDFEIEINWEKQKWKILENLFAVKEWWWIGYKLWEEIKKEHNIIFAYSKQEKYFENLWFKKIDWQKSKTWADLWIYEKKFIEK